MKQIDDVNFDGKLDKKLDEAGFAEFLVRSGIEDTSDEERVEVALKVFEKLPKVIGGMKELFRTKIVEDLKIKLTDKDLEAIDKRVNTLAETDTKRLLELAEKFEIQEVASANIISLNKDIEEYGRNFSNENPTGFIGNAKRKLEILGSWLSLGRPMQLFQERLKKGSENTINDTRNDLFEEIIQISSVHEAIKKRIAWQMNLLLENADSSEDLIEVQARLDELKSKEKTESSMSDILSKIDLSDFQKQLDDRIDVQVGKELSDAVDNVKLGEGVLSRLTASLEKYLTNDQFGSKIGIEARQMIADTLKNIVLRLVADPSEKAKVLLLKRVLKKSNIVLN